MPRTPAKERMSQMGKIKEMGGAKLKADAQVMKEGAQLLLKMQDGLYGVASEQGYEGLSRIMKNAEAVLARSGQVARALKALAVKAAKPKEEGYWELMIRNRVQIGEHPTTSAYRTVEAARAAMEEDIRETLAAKCPRFDEEDVHRIDENDVHLGDEIAYEIEWKDLFG